MKLLVDMNLPPVWCAVLKRHGWEAVHWSSVGDPRAPDQEVMQWARRGEWVVLTHDLDFGSLLHSTGARAPSVIQVRTREVLPAQLEPLLVAALHQFEPLLDGGALIVVDEASARARVLPLRGALDVDEPESGA